ncbi:MAG: GNAT family N-acetyltransferase [Caldilineaceae bacterium SB0670_bin_27]|uniref:GNAT family N-acetyltransferase n=1 Tax=Caldilineaceae bacterium SB0664_bin_27 TaxID=2605260 RepID=A0A6B0YXM6_9CHLR|nr:GNAT family N-acetyltransferase [Caldilineaceae bacterium SB0664_bin_27]MYJ77872.1 GNAT family N-acetyltransferase [Caldilineaceae bacterium SB0670_bin_27]
MGTDGNDVITYYLEMTSAEELRPARAPAEPFAVRQAELAFPALNRFFYTEVGRAYTWTTRLPWTEEQWRAWVERPGTQTWIGYVQGTPAGYFELEEQCEIGIKQVELAYFGLLPPFVGRGVGGALLTEALRRAWALGPQRVWVHTCTLDHPAALPNYQKRGFRIYDQKRNAE